MKETLINCKVCDAQIAKSAKRCPNCGAKNKKPIFRRWWFWGLLIVLFFALISSCGGSDNAEPAATETGNINISDVQVIEPDDSTTQQTVFHVGDALTDGDLEIVYMSSGTYDEENEFLQPNEGEKYIFLELAFKNISDDNNAHVSTYNFYCYADGFAAEMYYGSDDSLSATLSPGRTASGYIYFSVPEDANEIEIEYEPNVFLEDKIYFAFEGEKTSNYELEKNTTAAEDAYYVGSEVETSDVKISYLSWEEYISENMFVTSEEGNWFISCEFLFENLSDSDYFVSSFDFNCYADGIAVDPVFIREDDLSATISSGRMAQGTVTFEIPMDASVIEVEYVTDLWTSEHIVFSVS